MSSHTNHSSPKPVPKPDHRLSTTSQTKKPPPSSSSSSSSIIPQEQQQQTLKCPRCNSPNTKFCYYNNYSLSQPRHFCKSCRRYWTRGGALRNVPIGGGCRKTKKSIKPNSFPPLPHHPPPSSSQRFFSSIMEDSSTKFFTSPTTTTTMDFQLAGLSLLNTSNHQPDVLGHRPEHQVDFGSGLSLMGFGDYNNNNNNNQYTTAGEASISGGGNLASSIETLSCLNQDLHWRLQQQRMALLFGNKEEVEETVVVERPQPILYRNLEIVNSPTKRGENQTEWYFGNNSENEGVISNNGGGSSDQWNNGNNNIQAWSDLNNHYNALP